MIKNEVNSLDRIAIALEALAQSGGGGDSGLFKITLTDEGEGGEAAWTCDKTFDEIKEAYDSGKVVYTENTALGVVWFTLFGTSFVGTTNVWIDRVANGIQFFQAQIAITASSVEVQENSFVVEESVDGVIEVGGGK